MAGSGPGKPPIGPMPGPGDPLLEGYREYNSWRTQLGLRKMSPREYKETKARYEENMAARNHLREAWDKMDRETALLDPGVEWDHTEA